MKNKFIFSSKSFLAENDIELYPGEKFFKLFSSTFKECNEEYNRRLDEIYSSNCDVDLQNIIELQNSIFKNFFDKCKKYIKSNSNDLFVRYTDVFCRRSFWIARYNDPKLTEIKFVWIDSMNKKKFDQKLSGIVNIKTLMNFTYVFDFLMPVLPNGEKFLDKNNKANEPYRIFTTKEDGKVYCRDILQTRIDKRLEYIRLNKNQVDKDILALQQLDELL